MDIRHPNKVMKLTRIGSSFQTRISFLRRLIRQMHTEKWIIEKTVFDLDENGYGHAVYVIHTNTRDYSLICFSHYLDPDKRTDRVIADSWDSTFTLFDGIPKTCDITRLKKQTPKQEAVQFTESEIVLSRANKSLRLFDYVVEMLAGGHQPDPTIVNTVGYLMRTTAVYANGKFGLADRRIYSDRYELKEPYQAEMLTVYLIREFCHDLVDHIAKSKNSTLSVKLHRELKRHIGMGNATGLGMAPFLVDHPLLIHKWFFAKEKGLQNIRSIEAPSIKSVKTFLKLIERAKIHISEWKVEDKKSKIKIINLYNELDFIKSYIGDPHKFIEQTYAWNYLYLRCEEEISEEGLELLVSLLLEPYPDLINKLSDGLNLDIVNHGNYILTAGELRKLIIQNYGWVFQYNFDSPEENKHFWYYSQEKNEPRRGIRQVDPGVECEMGIAIAKDINKLYTVLKREKDELIDVHFMIKYPELTHTIRRIKQTEGHSYSEIHENVISSSCEPIDMLRGKLAFFGATKFDPKSELWTRITLCQGAPLRDEIWQENADDWCFPVQPVNII